MIQAHTPCMYQGSSSPPLSKRCRWGKDDKPSTAENGPPCIPWAARKTKTGFEKGPRPRTAPRACNHTSSALHTTGEAHPRTRRNESAGTASTSEPPCHPGSAGSTVYRAGKGRRLCNFHPRERRVAIQARRPDASRCTAGPPRRRPPSTILPGRTHPSHR